MKKQIQRINKKHESGRSMIEMVGVLAVMGLITAAAFVLISSAMRSQKLSRADDDVSALAAGVRLLYNNSAATTGFAGIKGKEAGTLEALGFTNVTSAYGSGSDNKYAISATQSFNASTYEPTTCASATANCQFFTISFYTGSDTVCSALQKRTWSNGGKAYCAGSTIKITFGYDQ